MSCSAPAPKPHIDEGSLDYFSFNDCDRESHLFPAGIPAVPRRERFIKLAVPVITSISGVITFLLVQKPPERP